MAKRKMKKNPFFVILSLMLLATLVAFYFVGQSVSMPIEPNIVRPTVEIDYRPTSAYALELVEHTGFTLGYDEDLEQARWLIYTLYQENVDKPNLKRPSSFKADPKVSTGSATHKDYTNSGYDRGHLAPNDDFNYDEELQKESFYMSNVSPQVGSFNRGEWAKLENYARSKARTQGDLSVAVGPIFRNDNIEYIGHTNHIAVPDKFFKILYHPASEQTEAFILRNSAEKQSYDKSRTTVAEVERETGLGFNF
jgi:endonuclease G